MEIAATGPSRAFCECGCGKPIAQKHPHRYIRRFVSGHNAQGTKRAPRLQFTCMHCAAPFEITPGMIRGKRKVRIFCSQPCRDTHRRLHIRGEAHPQFRTTIPVTCVECGAPGLSRPGNVRKRQNWFCKPQCGFAHRNRAVSGPRSSVMSWSMGKAIALERDQNRCRICGFDLILHVHHIEKRSRGGRHDPGNLITLCPNHHALADRARISPEQLKEYLACK
jgi:hypothetical protein